MEWLKDLEPLYQEADRFDREKVRKPVPDVSVFWQVLQGIRGLDHFLTQTPSTLTDYRVFEVHRGFVFGDALFLLSDGASWVRMDVAHDPVLWLEDCTPEVQARWKELEQEVLRMS